MYVPDGISKENVPLSVLWAYLIEGVVEFSNVILAKPGAVFDGTLSIVPLIMFCEYTVGAKTNKLIMSNMVDDIVLQKHLLFKTGTLQVICWGGGRGGFTVAGEAKSGDSWLFSQVVLVVFMGWVVYRIIDNEADGMVRVGLGGK